MTSVKLIASKTGQAYGAMELGLKALDIDYRLVFAEDEPDCAVHYVTSDAPCLVIDDRIVYHGCLGRSELEAIFAGERVRRMR